MLEEVVGQRMAGVSVVVKNAVTVEGELQWVESCVELEAVGMDVSEHSHRCAESAAEVQIRVGFAVVSVQGH